MKKILLKLVSLIIVCTMVLSIPIKVGAYTESDWSRNPQKVQRQDWKFSDALANMPTGSRPTTATVCSSDPDDKSKRDLLWYKKAYTFYNGDKYDIYVKLIPSDPSDLSNYTWGIHGTNSGPYTSFGGGSSKTETFEPRVLSTLPGGKSFDYEIWLARPREEGDPNKDEPRLESNEIVTNVPLVVGPCWLAHDNTRRETVRIYSDDGTVYTNIFNADDEFTKEYISTTGKEGWAAPDSDKTNSYDSVYYYMVGLGYTNDRKVRVGWSGNESSIPFEIRVGFDAYVVRFTDDESNALVNAGPGKDIVEDVPVGNKPLYPSAGIDEDKVKFWTLDQDISYVKDGVTVSYTTKDRLTKSQVQELLANITDANITKYYDEYTKKSGTNVLVASYKQLELTAHTYYKLDYKNQGDDTTTYPVPPAAETEMTKGESLAGKGDFVIGQLYTGKDSKQYRFEGWYEEAGVTTSIDLSSTSTVTMPGNNKTVYAKWTVKTDPVKVEFDMNGHGTGMTPPDDQVYSKADNPKANDPQDIDNTTPKKGVKDSSGYEFLGWYDKNGKEYNFATASVLTEDIKLTAKWKAPSSGGNPGGYIPPQVTLNFDPNGNGGYTKPGSQSGASGFTGKVPSDIKIGDIIDGYKFTGWFKDKDGKTPFDFKTGITNNTTAYAGWEKVDENTPTPDTTPDPEAPVVKVEFETEIGVPPATQVEVPGNTAEDPGAPMDLTTLKPGMVINGYRFEGWYLDKGYTVKYDFSTPLSEDIVLYAKWTAVGAATSPKTGEQSFPVAASLAGLALLGGLLIITSLKRRREDIYS